MTAPNKANVSISAAASVVGPTVGFCDATTSTTDEDVDLTEWAGRYVDIYCETEDHYVYFADATGGAAVLTAQSVGTVAIPARINKAGEGKGFVVPKEAPFLTYRAVTGTGIIRVIPS